MSARIHINAVGARTPLGLDAESSAAAARAGISRVAEHPVMVDIKGTPVRCAWDRSIGSDRQGATRLLALVLGAIREALRTTSSKSPLARRLPLFLALPNSRPGFAERDVDRIVKALADEQIPGIYGLDTTPIIGGHAGVFHALEMASACLRDRVADVCLVGGVDSYLDGGALDWLEADRRLAREGVRGGLVPGEAAGILVLSDDAGCVRLGLKSLALIRGVASGREPRSIDSDEGLFGEGLIDVLARVSNGLQLPDECVDDIYCDINGERHRVDEWSFAVMRMWQMLRDGSVYKSPNGSWGDIGAATAVVNCVLAVQAWRRKHALGPRSLVWGSSLDGLRGAAILESVRN
jgi:3-oxoacyl-[acyl-carrier-protein] synthase-1